MDRIKFRVNGTNHSVGNEVYSSTTLLDYLRKSLDLYGTKYMCREGGCGACIVTVAKKPGASEEGVNSCLVPITSCQDWNITTIEGIGNRMVGYHPLQTTLAENNGTQCGYCSPGWVMAMYSLLKSRKMTMVEVEQSLGSNLCRCTGYRPILESFKKFATDNTDVDRIMDIEDLNICKKTGEVCSKSNCDDYDWCLVSNDEARDVVHIELKDGKNWYRVDTLVDVFNILKQKGSASYMLVAGNTAKGVFPIDDYPNLLIDITGISELKGYYLDQNLVIGGGNTLTDFENIMKVVSANDNFKYLKSLIKHLNLVAHIPLKNQATIAGNLVMKNRTPSFKSDIFLILTAVGAQVTILSNNGAKKMVSMRSFLKEDLTGKILLNVLLPPLNSQQYRVLTFKVMPRSQNVHAIINCAFLYQFSENYKNILRCRICYSGLSANFVRAVQTEKFLVGKTVFTNETLQATLKVLSDDIVVATRLPDVSVGYKRHLALALFYKAVRKRRTIVYTSHYHRGYWVVEFCIASPWSGTTALPISIAIASVLITVVFRFKGKSLLAVCPKNILGSRYVSGIGRIHDTRPVSQGKQIFEVNRNLWPLNQPIPKLDGLVQCAGEAKYSDDQPSVQNEVFAAFVLTTVPRGKIDKIDPSNALKLPGVLKFYTASDIPGVNSFMPAGRLLVSNNEEILCDGNVKYYNQPLGIIVAETLDIAERAAKLVKVSYSNVKPPVIDIKIARNDPKRVQLFTSFEATITGNDIARVLKGEFAIYGQYHFCMETLVCVTHPTEQGLKVYVSSQFGDIVSQMTARALKIDQNRIDVVVRRVGGGYGYKLTRSTQSAVACNLVAYKMNRTCRFIQSLRANMKAVGKRLPASYVYEVGVNSKGVLQYLNTELYSDNGYVVGEELLILGGDAHTNPYNAAPWSHKAFNAFTDTPSNTWCRSPTTLEYIFMSEWIMERISYELNIDPIDVRLANLDKTHIDLKEMVEILKVNSSYNERKALVKKFNLENRWKKRGLRCAFMRWTPIAFLYFDINLSVCHEDGSVIITHGAVEMGQGLNTKAIQICAYFLQIPVSKIQVKQYDTNCTPNSFGSGGSVSTQNIGIGVQRCCEELIKRLEPVRAQMGNPKWEELIRTAHAMGVDLQTHGFINANDVQNYHIYGCTIAEVEIDVLTGEWEIIRVDLSEDVGRTVNQLIDIGQVEGGFMMGVGYSTCEELIHDPITGEVLTDRTWEYWIPQARDIPQDFRIYFKPKSYSTDLILGAKATGEPATCMGVVVALAMREAIVAARTDSGIPSNKWFDIDGPYTVEKICTNSSTTPKDFKFY